MPMFTWLPVSEDIGMAGGPWSLSLVSGLSLPAAMGAKKADEGLGFLIESNGCFGWSWAIFSLSAIASIT